VSHPSVFPTMRYADPVAAIEFLVAAFGAERHVVYEDGGVIRHAELRFGNGIVMLGGVAPGEQPYGGDIYIVVDDVDAHAHAHAQQAPRSCESRRTPTTARASAPRRISNNAPGTSAPTSRSTRSDGQRPDAACARPASAWKSAAVAWSARKTENPVAPSFASSGT